MCGDKRQEVEPDVRVAWLLCTELTTRITTQPLAFRDGDEATALASVADFFKLARKTVAENTGCTRCAPLVLDTLNLQVRPFTAKWHGKQEVGRLHSADERFRFRAELVSVQAVLRHLAEQLAELAGMPMPAIAQPVSNPSPTESGITANQGLTFGIPAGAGPHAQTIAAMNGEERAALDQRRQQVGLPVGACDVVGLALSGGGLRSATFGLGVVQALARSKLLKDVDLMSTVSGGGYLGSFISAHGVQALEAPVQGMDSARIRHLRNHSKYLAEGGLATLAHMGFALLNGAFVSGLLLVATLLVAGAAALLMQRVSWLLETFAVLAIVLLLGVLVLHATRLGRRFETDLRRSGALFTSLAALYATWLAILLAAGAMAPVLGAWWSGLSYPHQWIVIGAIAFVLLVAWFADPNAGGLHRYYRDSLARTFIVQTDADRKDKQPLPLAGLNGPGVIAPYHLINTALNVPDSKHLELRGRRSDHFLLSRHYCGSALTGWRPTKKLDMDLATAMAISGAAASPHMGTLTRTRYQLALSLLGLRLSYWLPWPKSGQSSRWWMPDGWLCFLRELTSWTMDERQTYLNLSDGGHIENLGVYELLRRRCRFIIAIDGECDPEHHFGGLLTLTRMAQIDLGICIQPDLADLRPNQQGWCNSHFVLAQIAYPETKVRGLLLYIKLSMTGNESEYLRSFRREHPDFPHQSTAQQLFSETQFEAYRALGEHVGEDLFASYLICGDEPASVASWMHALARAVQPKDLDERAS